VTHTRTTIYTTDVRIKHSDLLYVITSISDKQSRIYKYQWSNTWQET